MKLVSTSFLPIGLSLDTDEERDNTGYLSVECFTPLLNVALYLTAHLFAKMFVFYILFLLASFSIVQTCNPRAGHSEETIPEVDGDYLESYPGEPPHHEEWWDAEEVVLVTSIVTALLTEEDDFESATQTYETKDKDGNYAKNEWGKQDMGLPQLPAWGEESPPNRSPQNVILPAREEISEAVSPMHHPESCPSCSPRHLQDRFCGSDFGKLKFMWKVIFLLMNRTPD